jgi:hypothetical protein
MLKNVVKKLVIRGFPLLVLFLGVNNIALAGMTVNKKKCSAPKLIIQPKIGLRVIYMEAKADDFRFRLTVLKNQEQETIYQSEFGSRDISPTSNEWENDVKSTMLNGIFWIGDLKSSNSNYYRRMEININLAKVMRELKLGETVNFRVTEHSNLFSKLKSVTRNGKIKFLGCETINIGAKEEFLHQYYIKSVVRIVKQGKEIIKQPEQIMSYSERLGWWLKAVGLPNNKIIIAEKIEEK